MANDPFFEREEIFKSNRHRQSQDENPQFPAAPNKPGSGYKNDHAPNDFGQLERAKHFRSGNRHREAAVKEIKDHKAQARWPKPALLARRRREYLPHQHAQPEKIDDRDFDPPSAPTIKIKTEEVDVHSICDHPAREHQEKRELASAPGKSSRRADHRDRQENQNQT